MNLQTEVYISIDGEIYNKIDLAKNESISMKYVLKDTTDLSKIFSPFSLSFTFPGTLHNQRILGFVGNTKVYKTKTDSIFACKIYSNGFLAQSGKLKLTEIKEEFGKVKSFTANFTTTMISLQARMGEDLINDLPLIPAKVSWLPNDVFDYITSVRNISDVGYGIPSKYYVPLISRERIFQAQANTSTIYLDNVAYVYSTDPNGNNLLKSSEFRPAVQGRTIIDLILKKYNLEIEMPLATTSEYNDWYIHCNGDCTTEVTQAQSVVDFENPFSLSVVSSNNDPGGDGLPSNPRYLHSVDLTTNVVTVTQNNSFYPDRWGGKFDLEITLFNVLFLENNSSKEFLIVIKRTDGFIISSAAYPSNGTNVSAIVGISDYFFISGTLSFKIEIYPKQPSTWTAVYISSKQEYYHKYKYFTVKSVERKKWEYLSVSSSDSITSGSSKIDIFKSLPRVKCFDFLFSFFKTFNISAVSYTHLTLPTKP
jgi:hypothetical protein